MSTNAVQILQVEDDEDDRVLFAWAIKKAAILSEILHAVNGDECINKLKTYVPDIIFLDINMVGMNGKECLKLIRNQQQFDHIPIIILTTSDYESDITDTFQSGANLFVVKPFRSEDLTSMLKRIFADNWKVNLLQRDIKSYVASGR